MVLKPIHDGGLVPEWLHGTMPNKAPQIRNSGDGRIDRADFQGPRDEDLRQRHRGPSPPSRCAPGLCGKRGDGPCLTLMICGAYFERIPYLNVANVHGHATPLLRWQGSIQRHRVHAGAFGQKAAPKHINVDIAGWWRGLHQRLKFLPAGDRVMDRLNEFPRCVLRCPSGFPPIMLGHNIGRAPHRAPRWETRARRPSRCTHPQGVPC